MRNDLAVSTKPILTFSIRVDVESESGIGLVAVFGAGSPAKLIGRGR